MESRSGREVMRLGRQAQVGERYKWIALTNTTIGVLMVTISASITLISLPDIFRGIHLNPLAPATPPTSCGS